MGNTLRIATYNCENLFSRPRIFFAKSRRPSELLERVADLNYELSLPVFDKKRIDQLKRELRGYARIIEVRGRIDNKHTHGSDDWIGWVEFVRNSAEDMAVRNTAKVIAEVNADIICLMEVESRPQLKRFHNAILYPKFLKPAGRDRYRELMLIDGNDHRGIDVAVMSRHPITYLKSHVHERTQYFGRNVPLFSRDCLQVGVQVPDGPEVHLLINHFKSQRRIKPQDERAEQRRHAQASRVMELAESFNLDQEHVVVAGDLNSPIDAWSLSPLTEHDQLYNLNLEHPPKKRGTFQGKEAQLDYMFISDGLKRHFVKSGIERRGIYARNIDSFSTVTSKKTEASDHALVWGDFRF